MAITLNDIVALRTKIERDRKKLEEREKAVHVLEAMIQEESASAQHQETLAFEPSDTQINAFSVAVRDSTTYFEGHEFTVVNIEDLLTNQGIKMPQKYTRERISTILKKMVKHGLISITYKGAGSQPYRYRYLGKGTAQKVRPANAGHIAGLVSHASHGAPS